MPVSKQQRTTSAIGSSAAACNVPWIQRCFFLSYLIREVPLTNNSQTLIIR